MSSKGQVVIPSDMREGFEEGEKFVVIRSGDRLLLKSVNAFDKNIEEDLRFADSVEKAWKSHDNGEFRRLSSKEFLKELKEW